MAISIKYVDAEYDLDETHEFNVCPIVKPSGQECGYLNVKPATLCPRHLFEKTEAIDGSCKFPMSAKPPFQQCGKAPWFEGSKYCLQHRIHGEYENVGELSTCPKNGLNGTICGKVAFSGGNCAAHTPRK